MMNRVCIFITLLLSALTISSKSYSQNEFPTLEGPYMGQKPPGMLAEPFAPGIISKEGWELEGVFAPGMKEFYFTMDRGEHTSSTDNDFQPTVIGFRQENNIWTKYLEFPRQGEIVLSPDGQRMHMAEGYKDRIGKGWSQRKSLGPMFDREDLGIMRLSASATGTYVFDDYKSEVGIRISTLKGDKRQAPKEMGPVVNTGKLTAHPFIAPDESYLIWDSEREGGYGDSDLYICFRQKDGSWGAAINMGDSVNSDKWDAYASVTPDGKYILFNRGVDNDNHNVDIYWVDAQIIETLRHKQDESPILEGPYLGQTPPGLTPEPFAPSIVTTKAFEDGGVFSPDMNEFYFLRERLDNKKMESVVYKQKNNRWLETVRSGKDAQRFYPFFAPDDKTMHLGKRYKERTDAGWSEIKSLGSPFEQIGIMSLSASSKGMYVFDERGTDGDGVLRYSRLVDGKREAPRPFSKEINSGTRNAHPFIAPDESFIMWDGIKDSGFGSVDLYISFRQQDGSWGAAINMGDKINTDAYEAGAKVTPDGKYLFFVRVVTSTVDDPYSDIDIFWADAQIIETLRPSPY